jgi:hypothetical protein
VVSGQGRTYCWQGVVNFLLGGVGEGGLMSVLLLRGTCLIRSDMGLCRSVLVSFICIFRVLRLCTWKCCNVFSKGPFFSVEYDQCFLYCMVCCVSSMCCANLDFGFLALIAWVCSIKRVWKFLPLCPTYFNGQPLYFRKFRFC